MGLCGGKHLPIENSMGNVIHGKSVASLLTSRAPAKKQSCRSKSIQLKTGNIQDSYKLDMTILGQGAYGTVSTGVHKPTGAKRAVKKMSKGNSEHVKRSIQEISILKFMDHPNIVKLCETFEDGKHIYLVMEFCEGKELFDRITDGDTFTEKNAAVVAQQMLSAVFYLHKHQVCHRDLKPENLLFMSKGPLDNSVLKLIDFGLSACLQEGGQPMSTKAGTPYYMAPQVLQGNYDKACDIWSCGAIIYAMLFGYPPFCGKNDEEVLSKVRKGTFSFAHEDWQYISRDVKTLIAWMLKFNPEERCTAEQALQNTWITDLAPRAKNVSLQEGLVKNLRNFSSQTHLKKAALNIIAGQINESHIAELMTTFKSLDVNGDGLLTFEELQDGIAKTTIRKMHKSVDLKAFLEGVDTDGSGLIDYTEFLAATLDKKHYMQRDVCWAAFSVFDSNGDGKITAEELRKVLEEDGVSNLMDGHSSKEILEEVDGNGSGSIDFEEFMRMMRGGPSVSLHEITPKSGKPSRSATEQQCPLAPLMT